MNKFLKSYKEKVVEWFNGLTDKQQRDVVAGLEIHVEDGDTLECAVESVYPEFLFENMDAMLGRNCSASHGWDGNAVIKEILEEAMADYKSYSFFDSFIDDMAYHIQGYHDPKGFFQDLQQGGCQSGMIGMFIYNSDCKNFYVDHIDDLEDFKTSLEDEIGQLSNDNELPHYTFVCWMCYEEFAYWTARELFPDYF